MRGLRRYRIGVYVIALTGSLGLGLAAPIPSMPDADRTALMRDVHRRLPGWTVERVERSWEGAYTVVTACVDREVGFQWVPGHGLPGRNAWIQPNDAFSRVRLARTSDHRRHLVWYVTPRYPRALSCADEIAGDARTYPAGHAFD